MLCLFSVLTFLLFPAPSDPVTLQGEVFWPGGIPAAGAVVDVESTPLRVTTDNRGRFRLQVPGLPTVLLVEHERSAKLRVEVRSADPIRITLQTLPQPIDEVVVTGVARPERFAPAGSSVSHLNPSEAVLPGVRLADQLTTVPGIALNGQGGQFQIYSIRGMSRNRILTSISSVRLTSERRAGVSTSFVDPLLVGGIDVIRGAASSYHGSGAVGGVVEVQPRRFSGNSLQAGWASQGDEGYAAAGWGDEDWSLGLAARRADNAEDPSGDTINSHFRQFSGSLIREWVVEDKAFHLLILPAYGEKIGKPNSDYPDRVTEYPRERHLIAEFGALTRSLFSFDVFVHPQDLLTVTLEDGGHSEVQNRSTDFGIRSSKQINLGARKTLQLGLDYFGRRGVSAIESLVDSTSPIQTSELRTLDDALEDELGLQLSASIPFGPATVETGGRFLLLRQQNGAAGYSFADTSGSGYAGFLLPLTDRFQLVGSLGTGVRFPSLGERYYSGTTGRGEVIGNADLDSERTVDLEGGVVWRRGSLFASATVFQNWIDRYIERVESDPDVLTYRNLISGEIRGLEWENGWGPSGDLKVFARGHFLRGADPEGMPLADIPVHRLGAGIRYESRLWHAAADWDLLGAKKNPGSGEKPISSAHPLSAFVGLKVAPNTEFFVRAINLLNESYFATADRKSDLEPGRSIRFGISWSNE
jgi:iron complex outermembrane receptor protein